MIEIESSEVWWGPPKPVVDFHTADDEAVRVDDGLEEGEAVHVLAARALEHAREVDLLVLGEDVLVVEVHLRGVEDAWAAKE